ncbi:MAG: 4Fe-4S binding protein [Pseudomonadota bacterium]
MDRAGFEALVASPLSVGEVVNDKGVYELLNPGGTLAGYVFQTDVMAPLPGFSGAVITILVKIDLTGRFLDVALLKHNEPIFVSGLGEQPFRDFFKQYAGLSITDPLVVGTPYGDQGTGSSLVYLDGVTKATASVRIAHESILAATRAVAREKLGGVSTGPPAAPDPAVDEALTWDDLVAQGLVKRHQVTNGAVDALFKGTLWEYDDPVARDDPDGLFLDLWVVDVGPKSIARAALSKDTYEELQDFLEISQDDEPLLLIEAGRHGLVSDDFVRNTAPDLLAAVQDGLPIALRDSDIFVEVAKGAPDGVAMILRTDRRLGFDPTREWTLAISAVRSHGSFQPRIGKETLDVAHVTDDRFFVRMGQVEPVPAWLEAVRARQTDLIVLALLLVPLTVSLSLTRARAAVATRPRLTPVRLLVLAAVVGFVGWWGQGQLSIVTLLGVLRAGLDGASLEFLVYDPFSLVIWGAALVGFLLWGRALFCGWLCPFGALQEFAYKIGRLLRLPKVEFSSAWDGRLKFVKYGLLAGLVATAIISPAHTELFAEIEPFKTAITVFFVRDWFYVVYAAFWLVLGLFMFKGFCRYVCPLGAFMALGRVVMVHKWIARRAECGTPCQLCKVRCSYGAIEKTGAINYSECFGCLECEQIRDDARQCVPLILSERRTRAARPQPPVAAVPEPAE